MLIFGSSDMFPTAFPPILHSLYVCGSVHVGRMLPSVLGNIGGKSVARLAVADSAAETFVIGAGRYLRCVLFY
jgi:hypothetical protein